MYCFLFRKKIAILNQNSIKDTLERNRKTARAQQDKLELEIAELRSNLKLKDQRIITAEEEINLLRDKSGGATKALSKEKKRLEEIEDSLQKSIAVGKQRETQLKSEIETKTEEIGRLERKNAEMVRRLHQFDLEKDEMAERESRLNNLLSEGNETYGALQNEMESLKSQYERRLRVAEENRRECELSITSLEKDVEEMRSRLLASDKTNERLRADLENKERELQREKHQNKIREEESKEKIDGLYHDIKTQQKTLEAVTSDLEEQSILEKSRLDKKIDSLKNTLEERDQAIETLKRQKSDLQQNVEKMEEELTILGESLEQTRGEKNSLTVKLREQEVIDDELKASSNELSNLKSDKERLKLQLTDKQQELEKFDLQLQRADKRVEQLEAELRDKDCVIKNCLTRGYNFLMTRCNSVIL